MRAAGFSNRAPEVVIRVVSAGSNNLPAIRWHLRDISYGKHRKLETDDGERIANKAEAGRIAKTGKETGFAPHPSEARGVETRVRTYYISG